jgi:hypothetical protein
MFHVKRGPARRPSAEGLALGSPLRRGPTARLASPSPFERLARPSGSPPASRVRLPAMAVPRAPSSFQGRERRRAARLEPFGPFGPFGGVGFYVSPLARGASGAFGRRRWGKGRSSRCPACRGYAGAWPRLALELPRRIWGSRSGRCKFEWGPGRLLVLASAAFGRGQQGACEGFALRSSARLRLRSGFAPTTFAFARAPKNRFT